MDQAQQDLRRVHGVKKPAAGKKAARKFKGVTREK
jgi:hypothetical protein